MHKRRSGLARSARSLKYMKNKKVYLLIVTLLAVIVVKLSVNKTGRETESDAVALQTIPHDTATAEALRELSVDASVPPQPGEQNTREVKPAKIEFRSELVTSKAAFSSNPPREPGEERVLAIVRAQKAKSEKVRDLIILLPDLTSEEQVFGVEYATKFMSDAEYLNYRGLLLKLADSDAFREAMMIDVLTRGEHVRLPTLVEMLRLPDSETHLEIREILTAYLDKDYGPDASEWEAPLGQWLAQVIEE